MTFDELASAVIGLEPHEQNGFKPIEDALNAMLADSATSEAVKRLAAEGAGSAGRLRSGQAADPARELLQLRQTIDAMQKVLETEDAQRAASSSPSAAAEAPAEGEGLFEADPEILSEFISESMDHLQAAESSLLALESNPEDLESLNAVFRAFHSTKGTSSFLGLTRIKELAHHAEMLLDMARKGTIRLSGSFADLALESADTLKGMIKRLEQETGPAATVVPNNFASLLERLDHPLQAAGAAVQPPAAKSAPAPEAVAPPSAPVQAAPSIKPAPPAVQPAPPAPQAAAKPEAAAPRPAASPAPENKPAPAAAASQPTGVIAPSAYKPTAETAPAGESTQAKSDPNNLTATVRVSTDKLDGLINMVGELVITQAMIAQSKELQAEQNRGLSQTVVQLTRITRELQDLSMSLRMVPLKATFQKMERLVRDVAKKSGKQVKFLMEGEETEIDRNMVESLSDPLVHMLRNAVDHGLENNERRRAAGKSEQGVVKLRAYHAAGNVLLEISDDGGGLNRDKIIAKAQEKGLIDLNRDLTDAEVFKLIFLPGFSTADKVTDVSGRGVGLDVVKKNLETLRGRIDIASEPGRGTVFTLRIPLTLAIIDGMLIQVGRQQFILPTLNVQKAFRPSRRRFLRSRTGARWSKSGKA